MSNLEIVKLKAGEYFYSAKIYHDSNTSAHCYSSGALTINEGTSFSEVLDYVLDHACKNSGRDLERGHIHMLAFNQIAGAEQ